MKEHVLDWLLVDRQYSKHVAAHRRQLCELSENCRDAVTVVRESLMDGHCHNGRCARPQSPCVTGEGDWPASVDTSPRGVHDPSHLA